MQLKLHAQTKTIYVTTRKIASVQLEALDQLEDVWIAPQQTQQWNTHCFVLIVRDPVERFCSMYNFIQQVYHTLDRTWDQDQLYRQCLDARTYTRAFENPQWRTSTAAEFFLTEAMPRLAHSRDLHWNSQTARLKRLGLSVDRFDHVIPLQHFSRWVYNKHGWTIKKPVNSTGWQLAIAKRKLYDLVEDRIHTGVWKEDQQLYRS